MEKNLEMKEIESAMEGILFASGGDRPDLSGARY